MEEKRHEKKFEDQISEEDEQDSSLDHEIKAGEWQRLKEFRTYRKRTRQGKIIATHQAFSNRLAQLETMFYQLVSAHPQKATKLLKEIKRLRFLKEYLLQALIWEERGELEDHDMPDDLEELI